jgi:uridine kinase
VPDRDDVLEILAGLVPDGRVRVAIDGVDAAGKTTLADELAVHLQAHGRQVVRGSIDGFLRPRVERYRRGSESPEGYYHDSFDHEAVRGWLAAVPDAVLFDGVFLFRRELNDLWDFRVFVEASFEAEVRRRYERRYIPAQRLYLETVKPAHLADVVVENTNPASPLLRFSSQ